MICKIDDREQYPALYCYECGKKLRGMTGSEFEDIHTSSDGEDVCGECCDVCKMAICDECDMPMSEHEQQFDNAVCQKCLGKVVTI